VRYTQISLSGLPGSASARTAAIVTSECDRDYAHTEALVLKPGQEEVEEGDQQAERNERNRGEDVVSRARRAEDCHEANNRSNEDKNDSERHSSAGGPRSDEQPVREEDQPQRG
jgi:hypothetical protein